jgi:hypothetical protein
VIVLAGILGIVVVVAVYREIGWLRFRVRRRILVTLADGTAIEGILRTSARDGLVLTAGRMHGDEGVTVTLAGDTFVPRARVHLVQVLPAPGR